MTTTRKGYKDPRATYGDFQDYKYPPALDADLFNRIASLLADTVAKGAPRAQDTPDMTVYIPAFVGYMDGVRVSFAGGSTGAISAPSSNPRIDRIQLTSAGALEVQAGTEAASPTPPTLQASKIPICLVYLRVGATHIDDADDSTNAYIYADERPLLCSPAPLSLYRTALYQNILLNGNFQINQLGLAAYTSATVPANSDDTYLFDQWIHLSDGNDITDVSPEATIVPPGEASALKFEVETANKKFGIVQLIENKDAIKLAGKYVSLQLKARTTTDKVIKNIRAAVLSWSSTADIVTSDVVSAWGDEGANPTWATNWTAENTAANLALVADEWTTFEIENIYIDTAGMANLAVVIWVDDTDAAVDDLLYLGDVQLNEGATCLPYMPMRYSDELLRCKRFFQVLGGEDVTQKVGVGFVYTSTTAYIIANFEEMRVIPTLSVSAATDFILNDVASSYECSNIAMDTGGKSRGPVFTIVATSNGMTPLRVALLATDSTTNARLKLDARL